MKTKVMLITGAGRRIGAGLARYFHPNYDLILHYRNSQAQISALTSELNGLRKHSVKTIQVDFNENLNCENWLNPLLEGKKLDVLINNASSFFPTIMGEITHQDWEELFASNAKAPLFLSQAAYPYLKKTNGNIINIIDAHIAKPKKNYSIYYMAKHSLAAQTKALAVELAPAVRVNAVSPGSILWPEGENEMSKTDKQGLLESIPLKKQGTVSDIAVAIQYLLSAQYVTGEIIAVDGGRFI